MDQFNHLHYLDLKYLNEEPKEKSIIDIKSIVLLRKQIFKDFKFIVLKHNEVTYSDFSIKIGKHKSGIVLNFNKTDKIYLIKIHEYNDCIDDKIYLSNNSIFVHEDISIQRSNNTTSYVITNSKEFYHFDLIKNEQFFYNKLNFNIFNSLKTFFFTFNNEQKQKNQIIYYLHDSAILEHNSFVDISHKQLQDDSIEIFHEQNTSSNINYESLNQGKISSQLNSVIFENSNNCSTMQNIKHFIFNKNAITNSKPNLIIKNPNVIASHGNSIGSFNPEDLFYLQQKGLTKENAERILAKSKLDNLIKKTTLKKELIQYWKLK